MFRHLNWSRKKSLFLKQAHLEMQNVFIMFIGADFAVNFNLSPFILYIITLVSDIFLQSFYSILTLIASLAGNIKSTLFSQLNFDVLSIQFFMLFGTHIIDSSGKL